MAIPVMAFNPISSLLQLAHWLAQHGLELLRGHLARVAEIDLVMFAVEIQAVLGHEFVMQAVACGPFVVIRSDVQNLHREALMIILQPQFGQGW